MRKRRAAVLDLGLPYLVAEKEGRLLGYAEHEIAVYVERFFVARPWED